MRKAKVLSPLNRDGLSLFRYGVARQFFQVPFYRGVRVFKCVFLAPVDDGGRPDTLHDPVIDRAVWANVEQDICDVITDRQSRVRRLWSLLCRDQMRVL
jgi:hypothetical protein